MGVNPSNLEYLNLNTLRNYPIREEFVPVDTTGLFRIPSDFIADFQIAATSDITARFYISKVINTDTQVTVDISDQDAVYVGSFLITVASHTLYQRYYLTPGASYAGANAVLVVAELTNLLAQPKGIFSFALTATEVETRTVIPSVAGVSRIVFNDKFGNSYSLSGNVNMVAETNLRFRTSGQDIYLDAGEGLGLNEECVPPANYIKTFNGQTPDENGEFTFSGTACLAVSTGQHSLLFTDECCKPCVGCDDLSAITDRLTQIESDLLKLRDEYNSLLTTITNTEATIQTQCSC